MGSCGLLKVINSPICTNLQTTQPCLNIPLRFSFPSPSLPLTNTTTVNLFHFIMTIFCFSIFEVIRPPFSCGLGKIFWNKNIRLHALKNLKDCYVKGLLFQFQFQFNFPVAQSTFSFNKYRPHGKSGPPYGLPRADRAWTRPNWLNSKNFSFICASRQPWELGVHDILIKFSVAPK